MILNAGKLADIDLLFDRLFFVIALFCVKITIYNTYIVCHRNDLMMLNFMFKWTQVSIVGEASGCRQDECFCESAGERS